MGKSGPVNEPIRLELYFRSCSSVFAVHGVARPVVVPKGELIVRSLNSLMRSAEAVGQSPALSLGFTVVDDHSDSKCRSRIERLLDRAKFRTEFVPLDGKGNSASLKRTYELASRSGADLFYFAEDDYVHHRDAVTELLGAKKGLEELVGGDVVLTPSDNPDRYRDPYPSRILLGPTRYWRSVRHTTGVLFCSSKIFDDYEVYFKSFSNYGAVSGVTEDTTLNRIYESVPCFSPMPSLAVHLNEGSLSPFVDWRSWWEEAGKEGP